MKRTVAFFSVILSACVVNAASMSQLVLNDSDKEPEALVLRTSKIVRIPAVATTKASLIAFAKEQESPIAFFVADKGMIGFAGTSRLAFMDKADFRKLRTMTGANVRQTIDKKPMMEPADFKAKYSQEPRPKWPECGVKMPGDIQAVFLEKKSSKYISVESGDKMYVVELGSLSINKKGIKVKVHSNSSFVNEQGMHSVHHLGYPGAFYLYNREEFFRMSGGKEVDHDELMLMYKNSKSPVLYWDERNDVKFGVFGSKQIMFIDEKIFKKITNPRMKTRPSLSKVKVYKFEKEFQKAEFIPSEEYKEKYAEEAKPPYPTIPLQVDKDVQFVFMKNRVSDYLMIRTVHDRTFVLEFTQFSIDPEAKKSNIRFKVHEVE